MVRGQAAHPTWSGVPRSAFRVRRVCGFAAHHPRPKRPRPTHHPQTTDRIDIDADWKRSLKKRIFSPASTAPAACSSGR
ncbi:MAG: hypothetical protein JWP41_2907 [Ramlibacter sp.]|nr:hypothetical protein [Ramlibacter sp.]